MLSEANNPWTSERVDLLTLLWTDGYSCRQIAIRMDCGITRNAVIGKVTRLGLPGRKTKFGTQQRYRSGPVNYEEKQRREAERLAQRMAIRAARDAARAARQKVRRIVYLGTHMRAVDVWQGPQPEPIATPDFLSLTFDQLEHNHCRYPRGEGADLRYCGQPRLKGRSYCQHCFNICQRGAAA